MALEFRENKQFWWEKKEMYFYEIFQIGSQQLYFWKNLCAWHRTKPILFFSDLVLIF